MINKYSTIFNLDVNYVTEQLYLHVNDMRDFSMIDGVKYDDEETALVTFIYRLAFKPDKLGLNKKEVVRVDSDYEMTLTPEECIYYYADLLDIDPEIALSISYAECGGAMDSNNYLNNNNPAGIGPFMKFNNKEEGIIYYAFLLKHGYKLEEESDEEFFNCIAKTYCPDDPGHWIKLANSYYTNVSKDYLYYNLELKEEYQDNDYVNNDETNPDYDILEKINDDTTTKQVSRGLKKIKSTNS